MSPSRPSPAVPRPPPLRVRDLAVLLSGLLFAAVLSVTASPHDAVTVDEYGHLATGLAVVGTGDANWSVLNPPLASVSQALAAWPLLDGWTPESAGKTLGHPPTRSFWGLGWLLMHSRPDVYVAAFTRARVVTVAWLLLLGLAAWLLSRRLRPDRAFFAGGAAVVGLMTWPDLLAHGHLVTNDVPVTAALALSLLGLQRALSDPSPRRAALAGAALGVALLIKASALALVVALPMTLALSRTLGPRARARVGALVLATAGLVIVLAYGGEGVGTARGLLPLQSRPLAGLPAFLPSPVPVPWLLALDHQLVDMAAGDQGWLLGNGYHGGHPLYVPVTLAAKLPLTLMALGLLSLLALRRGIQREAAALLLPVGILGLLLAATSDKQHGMRVLLPFLVPFGLYSITLLAELRRPGLRALVGGLLITQALGAVWTWPHYLPYFNALAGGSEGGRKVLLDANLDWGQALPALRNELADRGVDSPIQLLYFGRVDPGLYGLDYVVPHPDAVGPGWLAVSPTLQQRSYLLYDHGRVIELESPLALDPAWGPPVAVPGGALLLFEVPGDRPAQPPRH